MLIINEIFSFNYNPSYKKLINNLNYKRKKTVANIRDEISLTREEKEIKKVKKSLKKLKRVKKVLKKF